MSQSRPPNLGEFTNPEFVRGRSKIVEAVWLLLQGVFVSSWLPGTRHRRWLLRLFGARLGTGVIIKPHVRIKFPWRLEVGDHSWIGESVWIDNLAKVRIGSNCCLSQGAYLCTGSHDWSRQTFDLTTAPIDLQDGCWIAAQAVVGPGVTVGEGAILALGSVASQAELESWTIYQGVPAIAIKKREMAAEN